MDTIEFEMKHGKMWLKVNAELSSICDKEGEDCRSYLFCDYLIQRHLHELKHRNINMFDHPMHLHELETVANIIGLKTEWHGPHKMVVIREPK